MDEARRFAKERLRDLQALFGGEAATVRAEISKHVQKITLPQAVGLISLLELGMH
jgi:hypothetical protein